MPKSKLFMSGDYVAHKAEERGYKVTSRKNQYNERYTIHAEDGMNKLTVTSRPLSAAEQQATSGWFTKFMGGALLISVVGVVYWLFTLAEQVGG